VGIRGLVSHTTGWPPPGRMVSAGRTMTSAGKPALAGALGRLAALAVTATFLAAPLAAAQVPATPDAIRIAISTSGRPMFDALVPNLAAVSGMVAPPVVTYAAAPSTLRAFCQGIGGTSPDVVLSTHPLRPALTNECLKNGVEHMVRVELGRGAFVLAVRAGSDLTKLTARQVYMALARDVPDGDQFRRNTAIRWSDLNRTLPQQDIRFQLPLRTDADRALFNALVMQGGCRSEPLAQAIFGADERTARCVATRVDRVKEVPRDQAVRELMNAPVGTVGVLPYRDVVQSGGQLVAIALDGVVPTDETIVEGTYEFATMYWLYAKRGQAAHHRAPKVDAAVDRIISYALTEQVIGSDGFLAGLGLIPISAEDRAAQRAIFTVQSNSYSVLPLMTWLANAATATGSLVSYVLGGSASTSTSGEVDFTALMDMAGYKATEFDTSVGIIPEADMVFGIVRELSEADKDYLERMLRLDARVRTGAVPQLQRKIVHSVLEVSEAEGYDISQVDIELLPLPSMKLVLKPTSPAATSTPAPPPAAAAGDTLVSGLSQSGLSQSGQSGPAAGLAQ